MARRALHSRPRRREPVAAPAALHAPRPRRDRRHGVRAGVYAGARGRREQDGGAERGLSGHEYHRPGRCGGVAGVFVYLVRTSSFPLIFLPFFSIPALSLSS